MERTEVLRCLAVPDTALAVAAVNWAFPGPRVKECPERQGPSDLDEAVYISWDMMSPSVVRISEVSSVARSGGLVPCVCV